MSKISIKTWIMAIRPKTLTAAIAPVLMATAMAYGDGIDHIPTAFICLIAAISVQIGTNLANDYYDFKKGSDRPDRIGPVRVTQAGLVSPEVIKKAFIIAFAIFALSCLWLFGRGGWPIIILGIISIISGILYTAGPFPLGYIGLGDLFVLIFFGPVALGATYYLQSYEINTAVILAGFAPGLISVAILAVNNIRDIESDKKSKKRTLAVRFGRSFGLIEYMTSIIIACLLPVFIFLLILDHKEILYSSFVLLLAIPTMKDVLTSTDGPTLNKALAKTGKLLLIFSIIFSIGWIL